MKETIRMITVLVGGWDSALSTLVIFMVAVGMKIDILVGTNYAHCGMLFYFPRSFLRTSRNSSGTSSSVIFLGTSVVP